MISIEVFERANTLVKRGQVIPCPDSVKPDRLHFLVQQRGGVWCDVYFVNGEWDCTAVEGDWGCVLNMRNVDCKKPFCSHTKAVQLYLKGDRRV